MDHLIATGKGEIKVTPWGLTIEAPSLRNESKCISIPYRARNEFMWRANSDKNTSCLVHGEKTGWENRLKTGDFDGFSVEDAVSFTQSWLFFSMLASVLNSPIDLKKFIRMEDGREYVTTEQMMNMTHDWQMRIRSLSQIEQTQAMESIEMGLLGWKTIMQALFPASPNAWYQTDPDAESILLSIGVLGESLEWTKMRIFEQAQLGQTIILKSLSSLHDDTAGGTFLYNRMIADKWCPSEITFIWKTLGLTGLYAASTIGPPTPSRDHKAAGCLKRKCLALNIEEGYKTLHTGRNCDCEQYLVDANHIFSILEEGKIPLISMSFTGDLDIEVIAAEADTPFVAVSHVWSDGLGNPDFNALHECQLRKLRDNFCNTFTSNSTTNVFEGQYLRACLIDVVSNSRQGPFSTFQFGGKVRIWIDTLCVPLKPELARKIAIQNMTKYYDGAAIVWVLDSSVMKLSVNDDPEKILFRIATSPWVRRLWTYQEAELAKKPIFQLSDTGAIVTEVWNKWWEAESISLFNRLPYLIPMLIPGFVPVRRADASDRLVPMLEHLRWRTTGKDRDEPLCMAALLDLDVRAILDAPEGEKKMIAFILLHPEFPADILFWRAERILSEENFGWCPKSFLAISPSVEYWKHGLTGMGKYTIFHKDESGQVAGFAASYSGFYFPEILEDVPIRFRQESGGKCYEWSADDLSANQGVIRGPRLGIVLRGPRPFNDVWHGILVTVWHESGGTLFADYLVRVQIHEIKDSGIISGDDIVNVKFLDDSQKWCIGSRPSVESKDEE